MAVCCPSVESYSPIAGRESLLMVLPTNSYLIVTIRWCFVSVLFCSSDTPAKCSSWWRTYCMPMQYWQLLFAIQDRALLLLHRLTRTWLGFRSGSITGACKILNSNKTKTLLLLVVYPGVWSLPKVTWSCLGCPFALVPTSTSMAWSLTASSHSN